MQLEENKGGSKSESERKTGWNKTRDQEKQT